MAPPDRKCQRPSARTGGAGRRAAQWALLAAIPLLSCRVDVAQPTELRCVFGGEFPPTDCAFVRGIALRESGAAWPRLIIRVGSFIPMVGYAYGSNAVATDSSGRFSLQVVRAYRRIPRTDPDTATIEFHGYAANSSSPVALALARARFVPQDSLVIVTDAELRFVLVPPP